ncbi:hypothetical protein Pd630_LPD10032 (plasmid) [Rhodococcus opacus PD630]|nr:hypothetical protein Pd630_LPD10032 [Rhodococcus opacus PD630]
MKRTTCANCFARPPQDRINEHTLDTFTPLDTLEFERSFEDTDGPSAHWLRSRPQKPHRTRPSRLGKNRSTPALRSRNECALHLSSNPQEAKTMRTKMNARVLAGATAGAILLAAGNAAVANAAPSLDPETPGNSDTQNLDPQTPSTPAPAAPAPSPEPAAPAQEANYDSGTTEDWDTYIPIPAEYQNAPTRSVPTYNEPTYYYAPDPATPQQTQEIPEAYRGPQAAPEPGKPVAPIQAAPDTYRFGYLTGPRPEWLPKTEADKLNNTASILEAQGATFFNSLGVPTTRSDRMAAAATAGGVGAGLVCATVAGGSAALIAGGGGAVIGFGIGSAVAGPLGAAPGAAIGAGVAAVGVGAPVAVTAGALCATAGALGGAAYGAGENMGEAPAPAPAPGPAPAPALPAPAPIVVDASAITAATEHAVAQAESVPGGTEAVDTVRTVAAEAPQVTQDVNETVRDTVLAQPHGQEVLTVVDNAAADANKALSAVGTPVFDALAAVQAGLNPA